MYVCMYVTGRHRPMSISSIAYTNNDDGTNKAYSQHVEDNLINSADFLCVDRNGTYATLTV